MPLRVRPAILLLIALCFFAATANVHSQDSDETDGSNRDAALQASFSQFPFFTPLTNAEGQPDFQTLPLKDPVVFNHERFFGLRFKVPPRASHEDLVWGFVEPGDLKEWYILPETGEMDGFTNYYTTSKGDYMGVEPLLPMQASHLILQHLPGENLKDGQTCLIWFGFGNYNAPAMSLTFTFTNFDPNVPHPLVAIEKLLALNQLASGPVVNPVNHHTYMLLRPTNWERAEKLAEKLGGHLATIRNQQEEDWIFNTFGDYGGERRLLWIGLNDLDNRFHFSWASGESASYTDWARHEPNNAGPRGEDYVAIFYPGHSQANKWKVWNSRGRDPIGLPMDGVVEIVPANNLAAPNPTVANAAAVQILPNVTITSNNGSITLEWPLSASGYILEATTNLSEPFTEFGYSEQTNLETGVIYVTITNPSPQMFFELEKPELSQ
jgi:Lectin C-type domain